MMILFCQRYNGSEQNTKHNKADIEHHEADDDSRMEHVAADDRIERGDSRTWTWNKPVHAN